ncbi:DhaKLM operon coactivator DhaQ [Bienertia sinuspersici]
MIWMTYLMMRWLPMKNVLRASWKPVMGMAVREIVKNLFVFQFINHTIRKSREQPKDLAFDTVVFWVKLYNVPFHKRTKGLAATIGNKIGMFLDYDDSDKSRWSKSMRVRVQMNVHKPLPGGTPMRIMGERFWVDFRIERLPGFVLLVDALDMRYGNVRTMMKIFLKMNYPMARG